MMNVHIYQKNIVQSYANPYQCELWSRQLVRRVSWKTHTHTRTVHAIETHILSTLMADKQLSLLCVQNGKLSIDALIYL